MNDFKENDRVILINIEGIAECETNPLWGGKYGYMVGTVYNIGLYDTIWVEWDNNKANIYFGKKHLCHYNRDEIPEEFWEI